MIHLDSLAADYNYFIVDESQELASQRKKDHLDLAFRSRVSLDDLDDRFFYEPLLSAHPVGREWEVPFLGKMLRAPIWISSMTGGTAMARTINHHLARVCRDYGLGMGLGSCRILLDDDTYLADFNVRPVIGDNLPLYGNLGIAQVESLLERGSLFKIERLLEKLRLDGLIIHLNPLQEWLQDEGDHIKVLPLVTIEKLLNKVTYPVMVKEVGQGMGRESLRSLFQLPLMAVDYGAHGGTNFAMLEILRAAGNSKDDLAPLARVGHSALEMVQLTNHLVRELGDNLKCRQVIISGGIGNFLDAYYLMQNLQLPSIYGQASAFLKHATGDYEQLFNFVGQQIEGLMLARTYLRLKT